MYVNIVCSNIVHHGIVSYISHFCHVLQVN